MSRLSNFSGLSQTITIDDKEFKIFPLKARHQSYLKQLADKNDATKNEALFHVFKESLIEEKDITKEEILDLPIPIQDKLLEAVIEVNGYGKFMEDAKKKVITGTS